MHVRTLAGPALIRGVDHETEVALPLVRAPYSGEAFAARAAADEDLDTFRFDLVGAAVPPFAVARTLLVSADRPVTVLVAADQSRKEQQGEDGSQQLLRVSGIVIRHPSPSCTPYPEI